MLKVRETAFPIENLPTGYPMLSIYVCVSTVFPFPSTYQLNISFCIWLWLWVNVIFSVLGFLQTVFQKQFCLLGCFFRQNNIQAEVELLIFLSPHTNASLTKEHHYSTVYDLPEIKVTLLLTLDKHSIQVSSTSSCISML